jgi:glycosyltransferase involved in cell wall biosynthesis
MTQGPARNLLLLIPNLGRGGAQQVFNDQLRFYSHFQATGCVFNWDGAFVEETNLNIVSLDVPAGKNFISKLLNFFKRVKAARALKRKLNINVTISHLEGADYVNILSKIKGERIICWVHGSKIFDENIEGTLGILRRRIFIPLAYSRCDKIVTVSEGIRQELIQTFGISPKKITTIYNSFDLETIGNNILAEIPTAHARLFENCQILITHCRLSRQKNLFALIDIYQEGHKTSGAKLMILGDGELREELLAYCKKKNLNVFQIWDKDQPISENFDIYFLGYERNPFPYLSRASLYMMTSSWEGFPLSLCEAMACGLPVISSDCHTGPREIIAPGLHPQPIEAPLLSKYGMLMPLATEKSLSAWAETLTSLLQDARLRETLSKSGKERVLAFDRKTISEQWLKILDDDPV